MTTIYARETQTFIQKTKGLLGQKKAYPLLLKTHFGIHTFFMKFPIDVVVLNEKGQIKSLKENLVPNRFFFWNPRYNRVIELPKGEIKRLQLKRGNKVQLGRL